LHISYKAVRMIQQSVIQPS